MLTATIYAESGGVGKSTLTAALSAALTRRGHRVLAIDMDPQDGGLSHLFDVDDDRADSDADNLVKHMLGYADADDDFRDIIRTSAGVDVIPSHNKLEEFERLLEKEASIAEDLHDDGFEYPKNRQLRRLLDAEGVYGDYDVILVDPPATAGERLYNAVEATLSLVIPLELSGKGKRSLGALEDMVAGLETQLGVDIGAMAVVPNRYAETNDQTEYLEEIQETPYPTPVTFGVRNSLFEGCWKERCDPFTYMAEHRSRTRPYERETLEKIDTLAEHLAVMAGIEDDSESEREQEVAA